MEATFLDALKSLSPSNILLVSVIVFLWKEWQKEREARISAYTSAFELGHAVRAALDRQQELITQLIARKD